ncbi:MAG: hypothetical protein M3R15_29605, partial [Acidobacteriota bacterium]|nr:hypothetical protein [Acidobacteriota bacterium]
AHKQPHLRLDLQQIPTGASGSRTLALLPSRRTIIGSLFEKSSDSVADLTRIIDETAPLQCSISYSMVVVKQFPLFFKQLFSNLFTASTPFRNLLKLSFQMGPTKLSAAHPVVSIPSITDNSGSLSKQTLSRVHAATQAEAKGDHPPCDGDPQPSLSSFRVVAIAITLWKARLIGIDHILLLDKLARCGDRFGHRVAGFLTQRIDAPDRDIHLEDLRHRLLGHSFTRPVGSAQDIYQCHRTWAIPAVWNMLGQRGTRACSTVGAVQTVSAMLLDIGNNLWHFYYLMANRALILTTQLRAAVAASWRKMINYFLALIGGDQFSFVANVSNLTATLGGARERSMTLDTWFICRRRKRRVTGVTSKLLAQVLVLFFEFTDSTLQLVKMLKKVLESSDHSVRSSCPVISWYLSKWALSWSVLHGRKEYQSFAFNC